jgi:hypothetical protein
MANKGTIVALPKILYRGVASGSPHHREAQTHGSCTPRGSDEGHGLSRWHSGGDTDSVFTSWTATRDVAEGYARSSPNGVGVVLEISFAEDVAATHQYFYQGDRLGEDEYLIMGTIRGVRVRSAKR